MNDLFSILTTSLCIRYLSDNLKKSSLVMSFHMLASQIFVFSLDLLWYFEIITDVLYITDTEFCKNDILFFIFNH